MRRLILTAATLLLFAIAAPAAQADEPPFELVDPATGLECSQDDGTGELVVDGSDVSGGCLVEDFNGSYQLAAPGFGVFTSCTTSFDLRIDSTGNVVIYDQGTSYSCGGSPRQVCHNGTTPYSQGDPLPWTGQLVLDGDQFVIDAEMCIQSPNNPGYHVWMDATFDVELAETGNYPSIESLTNDGEDPICQGCGWLAGANFSTYNDDSVDFIW